LSVNKLNLNDLSILKSRFLGFPHELCRFSKLTWQSIHIIRKLNIYNFAKWALILVPIVGTFGHFLNARYNVRFEMPVDLLLTYFSALFFLASSLLADIFCPTVVRTHKDFGTFLDTFVSKADAISQLNQRTSELERNLLEKLAAEVAQDVSPETKSEAIFIQALLLQASKTLPEAALRIWNDANDQKPLIKLSITIGFFFAATIAIYISFYDAPLRVIKALRY